MTSTKASRQCWTNKVVPWWKKSAKLIWGCWLIFFSYSDAIDAMEREANSTRPLFVLHLYKLKRHLNASSHDCELSWIKKHAAGYLEAKFRAHDIHVISMFLWTQFRQLCMLSESDRHEVLQDVRQQLQSNSLAWVEMQSSRRPKRRSKQRRR